MTSPAPLALVLTVWLAAAAAGPASAEPEGGFKSPGQSNDGQNRRVRIHNQTGWTMTALYVSDGSRADWRGDVLTRPEVASGESVLINVDDGDGGCVYVLRAEFTNGQALERSDVNACRIADYYFTR